MKSVDGISALFIAFAGCCFSFVAGMAYVKHDPDNFTQTDCQRWIVETRLDEGEMREHQCDKRVRELGDIYESVCRRSAIP